MNNGGPVNNCINSATIVILLSTLKQATLLYFSKLRTKGALASPLCESGTSLAKNTAEKVLVFRSNPLDEGV